MKDSKAVENFYLSEDKSYALVNEEAMHEAFAHDIPLENFNAAKPYIVPEPSAPLSYALEVSDDNFGKYQNTISNVQRIERFQLKYSVPCIKEK